MVCATCTLDIYPGLCLAITGIEPVINRFSMVLKSWALECVAQILRKSQHPSRSRSLRAQATRYIYRARSACPLLLVISVVSTSAHGGTLLSSVA